MNGQVLNTFDITEYSTEIITAGLQPGNYIVGIEKGEFSMKKKIVVAN